MLVEHLEPPDDKGQVLVRRFDLNHDGKLRGPEAKLAGDEWIRRVLYGLQFEVVGEKPRAREPEIKFHREPKGSLTSAVYARWDLPKLAPGAHRTVVVRLLSVPNNVATEISFEAGEHTEVDQVDLPARLRGKAARPMLRPGEQASVRVQRIASSN